MPRIGRADPSLACRRGPDVVVVVVAVVSPSHARPNERLRASVCVCVGAHLLSSLLPPPPRFYRPYGSRIVFLSSAPAGGRLRRRRAPQIRHQICCCDTALCFFTTLILDAEILAPPYGSSTLEPHLAPISNIFIGFAKLMIAFAIACESHDKIDFTENCIGALTSAARKSVEREERI